MNCIDENVKTNAGVKKPSRKYSKGGEDEKAQCMIKKAMVFLLRNGTGAKDIADATGLSVAHVNGVIRGYRALGSTKWAAFWTLYDSQLPRIKARREFEAAIKGLSNE